jgi:hypothetical protein
MPRNANIGDPLEVIEIVEVPAEVPVPEPAPV